MSWNWTSFAIGFVTSFLLVQLAWWIPRWLEKQPHPGHTSGYQPIAKGDPDHEPTPPKSE